MELKNVLGQDQNVFYQLVKMPQALILRMKLVENSPPKELALQKKMVDVLLEVHVKLQKSKRPVL
jgi:hypothetical protein